jgi:hypothetical protein
MASVHGKPEDGVECEFPPPILKSSSSCFPLITICQEIPPIVPSGATFESHLPGTKLHRFLSA